jgi:hypothetical protein
LSNILNALALGTVGVLIESGEYTSTETGTGIDLSLYEGEVVAILNSSAKTAGTDPTLDVKLQHDPAVGGSYADITGATFAQVTTVASIEAVVFNASECDAFVRAVGTIGGTVTPTFDFGVAFYGIKKTV